MAANLIIQCLEHFGDGFEFERLCNDVMKIHYGRLEPIGGYHDGGIDGLLIIEAEDARFYFNKAADRAKTIVFQYSIQEDWNNKLKKSIRTLETANEQYDQLIFVTNQRVDQSVIAKIEIW